MADRDEFDKLMAEADSLLGGGPASDDVLQTLLVRILAVFECVTGTVHHLDDNDGHLHLSVCSGIPPVVAEKVKLVPVGKGMAGLAAERLEPVSICNLQTDDSGDARPGAKATGMEGCIALPMLEAGRLKGVLGVAKPVAYEFGDEEKRQLLQVGERIAAALSANV